MELCEGQSLKELLKRRGLISESEVRYFIRQLLDVMEYMKSNRIIHRDLKLANIFLTKDLSIRVGDFGLARQLEVGEDRRR